MATGSAYELLEQFHREAERAALKYLIIGGFAASHWGTPRFTADVDFAIAQSELEKAGAVADRLGYSLAFLHPRKAFAHFEPGSNAGFRIDFMLVDSETWRKLEEGSSFADFGGTSKYPIVSAVHLLAMKLHAAKQPDRFDKFKDLSDIAQIMRAQGITLEELESSGVLSKHGNQETLSLLRSLLGS